MNETIHTHSRQKASLKKLSRKKKLVFRGPRDRYQFMNEVEKSRGRHIAEGMIERMMSKYGGGKRKLFY